MTKTRPSSAKATIPAWAANAASKARAEQESWSDCEDSLGYHVAYPSTTKQEARAEQESWGDCEDSLGYHVSYPQATPKPKAKPAPESVTVEPTMTTISIGGILAKIPASIAASKPAINDTTAIGAIKMEHERAKRQRLWPVQGCYSTECSPVEDVPKPAVALGFATTRPWTEEVAMAGYAFSPTKTAKPTDESESSAACTAVSPAVVLAGISADSEGVPVEVTMQGYGRILHQLPGDEKRKVMALMESIEELFPSTTSFDMYKWYLSAIGALIGSGLPSYVGDLYLYICAKPEYQTPPPRQALVRRTRDALFKCVPLNGIAVVTEAFAALAAVEAPQDQDHGTRWAGTQITPETLHRARATIEQLHGPDHVAKVYEACGSHKDLAWINENIIYGLFLADHSILSVEETELVVLPAFIATGLKGPVEAHLKAALRLGMSVEEVEQIHRICEMLASWKGTSLTHMKRAASL